MDRVLVPNQPFAIRKDGKFDELFFCLYIILTACVLRELPRARGTYRFILPKPALKGIVPVEV